MRALLKDSGMRTFTQTFSSASPGRWPRLWLFCVLLVYNVSCDQFGSDDEIAGEGSFCVYFHSGTGYPWFCRRYLYLVRYWLKYSNHCRYLLSVSLPLCSNYSASRTRRMACVPLEPTQTAQCPPWSVSLARPASWGKALPQPVGVPMTQSVRIVGKTTTPN